MDMESSRIGAIVPAAGLRRLLECAMVQAESPAAMLLSEDNADRQHVWSWWRRGRFETSPLVSDAIRTIARCLFQHADALEAYSAVVPVELGK